MLTPAEIRDMNMAAQGQAITGVHPALHLARAIEAAATAEARALVQLALEELDDGEVHAQDCMTRYGGYPCRCTKPATVAKLRAFLGA